MISPVCGVPVCTDVSDFARSTPEIKGGVTGGRSAGVRGVVPPLITPFTLDGKVDRDACGRLIASLREARFGAYFTNGTTGEALSMEEDERVAVTEAVVDASDGSTPVFAGIATQSVVASVKLARRMAAVGAKAVVAHLPLTYRNVRASEVEKIFLSIAESSPIRVYLYNYTAFTGITISLQSIERLSGNPNICGIKESDGDPVRVKELIAMAAGRADFTVLLGATSVYAEGLRSGAHGLVPSYAQDFPLHYAALWAATEAREWEKVNAQLLELGTLQNRFGKGPEQNIPSIKDCLASRGICGPAVLLPLAKAG